MNRNIFVTFTLLLISIANGKVAIKKLEMCDPKADYPIKFTVDIKTENDKQIIEKATLKNTVELNNDISGTVDIYSNQDGNYQLLTSLKENYCSGMDKFLGEFHKDINKSAGLAAETCDLAPGEYSITNHELDFDKLKISALPSGEFRLKSNMTNAKGELLSCSIMDVTV